MIQTGTLMRSVGVGGEQSFIDHMAICVHGRYLAAVHARGALKVHDIDAILTAPPLALIPASPSVGGGTSVSMFSVKGMC